VTILSITAAAPCPAQHAEHPGSVHASVAVPAGDGGEPIDPEDLDRASIIELLQHRDIRALAVALGADLDSAVIRVQSLEGEPLRLAADQARRLTDEESRGFLPSPSTIILLLLLAIILHIGA
jgi:hypothetical protein